MGLLKWQEYLAQSITKFVKTYRQPAISSIYLPSFLQQPTLLLPVFDKLFSLDTIKSHGLINLIIVDSIYKQQFLSDLPNAIDGQSLLPADNLISNLFNKPFQQIKEQKIVSNLIITYKELEVICTLLRLHNISVRLCLAYESDLENRLKYICDNDLLLIKLTKDEILNIKNIFYISSYPIWISSTKRQIARQTNDSCYLGTPVAIIKYSKLVELNEIKLPNIIYSGIFGNRLEEIFNRTKVLKPELNFYDVAMMVAILQSLLFAWQKFEPNKSSSLNILCFLSKEKLYEETNFTNDFILQIVSYLTPDTFLQNFIMIIDLLIELQSANQTQTDNKNLNDSLPVINASSSLLTSLRDNLNIISFTPEQALMKNTLAQLLKQHDKSKINLLVPARNPLEKTVTCYQQVNSLIARSGLEINTILIPVDLRGTFSISLVLNTILYKSPLNRKKIIMNVVVPDGYELSTACEQYSATDITRKLSNKLKSKIYMISSDDKLSYQDIEENFAPLGSECNFIDEKDNDCFELIHKD